MRSVFLVLLSVINLIAGTEYYTKEIIFKKIMNSTLVRVKIDDELYSKMVSNDIRVYSSDDVLENHFIKSNPPNLQSYSSDDGYDITTFTLLSKSMESTYTDYIFRPDGTPADRIILNIKEDEYNRTGKIYVGNTQQDWHFLSKEPLEKVKFSEKEDKEIALNSSTKFIRLRVENYEKSPLTIESIRVKTAPNYLYFIAKPNQQYYIHFTKKEAKNSEEKVLKAVELNKPFIEGRLDDLKIAQMPKVKEESSEKVKDKGLVIAIVIAVVVLFSIAIGLIKGKETE